METPIRELPRTELPRPLVYVTGMLFGVFAAMTTQVLLTRVGMELSGAWGNLMSGHALQLRGAGAWWLMGGAAFLTGAVVVAALSRLPWPWHRYRLIRWVVGAALVAGLAEVGHIASVQESHAAGVHVALTLFALCAAALISLFGGYFAAKR